MNIPLVAVVGRPNVGKSTLFNKLVGKRIAIVEDTPGVTRDRIYADVEWLRYRFTLIDTGGIEPDSQEVIPAQMRMQAELAMETADVILFLVDSKQGVQPADYDIADMLRKTTKPVVLAVNKIDSIAGRDEMYEFYALGLGDPIAISAEQGLNLGDLLDEIASYLEAVPEQEEQDRVKIAVVGKPNVGKSSLVNFILGQERSIVSDIAGTTRDAVDTPFERDGRRYLIVDTAGIRRKRSVEDETVERYGVIRALTAVRRCDVCLIVLDALLGIREQDVKIAGYCHEEGKACVVLINKWDIIEKDTHTINRFKKDIETALAFMSYVPQITISAVTGQRVNKVLEMTDTVYAQYCKRVTTGTLNQTLHEAVAMNEPPSDKGRRLKIYYATQGSTKPPTFILFVNDPGIMHFSYKRYLENYLRKTFDFSGTPIRLVIRKKGENEG